jgi:hypothetical protein
MGANTALRINTAALQINTAPQTKATIRNTRMRQIIGLRQTITAAQCIAVLTPTTHPIGIIPGCIMSITVRAARIDIIKAPSTSA